VPRRVHREEASVVVEADAGGPEAEAAAEPELLGQTAYAVVGRQDHVIEAIDAMPVEVEGADEAAEIARALVDGHLGACLKQPVGRGEPEDPAADDADPLARHADEDSLASRSRTTMRQ